MNLVAARHLELISTRFNLENLVGQMLQESIYQSMMVRFHLRREFLGTVLKENPPGRQLVRTAFRPLLRPGPPRLLGPETPVEQPAAKEVLLLAGEQRAQLDRSLDELKAKVEVLDKGYGGDYRLLREQIKEARARVDKWKEEIYELDLAPDDVQEKFFPGQLKLF